MVKACMPPDKALVMWYSEVGEYVDCFVIETGARVSLPQFVEAFYTSWLFKMERLVLTLATPPSSDMQAAELAAGRRTSFAAWEVESRAVDQLLMRDFTGRTRSWFMVAPAAGGTRLYFGSAITATPDRPGKSATIGPIFRVLVGPHRLHSRALLAAASRRLKHQVERVNL